LEKALVFDIWGNYAYFRKGYTATSTLTYPFPSRTTIAGIVSAILGFEKNSYYNIFNEENSKISLRILKPIKKFRMNLNYINTKEGFLLSDITSSGKRTQIQAEFLKDVKYRIYLSLEDKKIMNELFDLVYNHKSIYTPCLGISECIANFKIVGEDFITIENIDSNYGQSVDEKNNILIDSIVPSNNKIIVEPEMKYGIIKSPQFMNQDRQVISYIEHYYEENGNPIKIETSSYSKIGADNVIFF